MRVPLTLLFGWMACAAFAEYHDYYAFKANADSLLALKPGIVQKKLYGLSVNGLECYALKISDNAAVDEDEPEIAFDAGTHGGELVAQEMIYHFMRDLVREYDTDSTIRALVDSREIWIYPLVSPDARQAVSRLTRSTNLNRDWGFMWLDGTDNGPVAFRLQETRAAAQWVLENHFTIHQTNHDGTALFAVPWGFAEVNCADSVHYWDLGGRYDALAPYIRVGFYTAGTNTGTASMYCYGVMGAISYTMEVNGTMAPANADSIVALRYPPHKLGMLEMVRSAGRGVAGTVVDDQTSAPVAATLWIEDGRRGLRSCYNDPAVGDFQRYLAPGAYTVRATANGYAPSAPVGVTVTSGGAARADFRLAAAAGHYGYRVVNFANPGSASLDKVDSWKMLGAPDGRRQYLGVNGYAVVDMGAVYRALPGVPEISVIESDGTPEGYSVSVGLDWNGPWTPLGADTGSAAFDLADGPADSFRYVKILDDGDGDTLALDAGFELDGVEVFTPGSTAAPAAAGTAEAPVIGVAPNPFGPSTVISLRLPGPETVTMAVYDPAGRRVRMLGQGAYKRGVHRFFWDGADAGGSRLSSGVYLIKLAAGRLTCTQRLVLAR